MDDSHLDKGKVEADVVWFDKRLDKWQEKRRFLGKNKYLFDAELSAISDTLILSIKKIRNIDLITIIVFTDSQAAITKILDPKARVGKDEI